MKFDRSLLRRLLRDPKSVTLKGLEFGRYELLGQISRGGMGAVFRAQHRELGALVALKVMLEEEPGPEAVERFKREARVLAQLKHPNVVGVTDLGTEDEVPYLVMELIEGRDLFRALTGASSEPLDVERTVEIGAKMAEALAYCHGMGAVHRDVKPHNILLEQSTGRPVLTDFGLVKRDANKLGVRGESSMETMSGEVVGTPAFMSPEQFDPGGEFGDVGPATDVWGLGATLFFLLTGRAPFVAKNVVDLFAQVSNEPPPNPATLRPDLPEDLTRLLLDMLAKHAEQRLDMSEVAKRLEAVKLNQRRRTRGRGVRHGLILALGILCLISSELFVIHPERGQALFRVARGEPWYGEPAGMVRLGTHLLHGPDSVRDPKRALLWFERAAQAGDPTGMYWLGHMIQQGKGTERDPTLAREWFARAAEGGNPRAMLWMGYFYENGQGVDRDRQEAVRWYRLAAAGEDPEARTQGQRRLEELGVER